MPWKTFLQAPWAGLAACDLFTVEVVTRAGLRRYLVFFVIELRSPPRAHRRDPPAAGRRVDGAAGPQCDRPGRWLFAQGAPSDSRPRSPLYAGLWRDPGERRCSADSAAAEESQSQRLCRAVRQVDQRGVSHTRGPARRGAICVVSSTSTETTTIARETTRDSTTSSCNDHHLREGRPPTFGGGYAAEDDSVFYNREAA